MATKIVPSIVLLVKKPICTSPLVKNNKNECAKNKNGPKGKPFGAAYLSNETGPGVRLAPGAAERREAAY